MLINSSPINSLAINGNSTTGIATSITVSDLLINTSEAITSFFDFFETISTTFTLTSPTLQQAIINLFTSFSASSSQSNILLSNILEQLNLLSSTLSSQDMRNVLIELLVLTDQLSVTVEESLSNEIGFSTTLSLLNNKVENLLEILNTSSSVFSTAEFNSAILDTIAFIDSVINNNQTVSIVEQLIFTLTESVLVKLYLEISSNLIINSGIIDSKGILVLSGDVLNINSITNTSSDISVLLSSNLVFIIPDQKSNEYSTFLYNPESPSISNYTDFNFDGITKFNDKYLFYNKSGLYEFGGKTDDGLPVITNLLSPAYSFGSSNLKQVPSVYMGVSLDNSMYLKVSVDGKANVTYKLNKRTDELETLKISVGKGLIGRYFQFELITEAEQFDMESIEFFPIDLRRKL